MRAKEGRLHIRVDEDLLRRVKKYAKKNGVTLTDIVEARFRELLSAEKVLRSLNQTGDDVEQV